MSQSKQVKRKKKGNAVGNTQQGVLQQPGPTAESIEDVVRDQPAGNANPGGMENQGQETVEESKTQTVGHTNPESSRSNNQRVSHQEDEFGQYVSGEGFYQHVPGSRCNTDRTREQLGIHQNIEAHAAEARPRQLSGYGPESRGSRPLTSRPVFSQ